MSEIYNYNSGSGIHQLATPAKNPAHLIRFRSGKFTVNVYHRELEAAGRILRAYLLTYCENSAAVDAVIAGALEYTFYETDNSSEREGVYPVYCPFGKDEIEGERPITGVSEQFEWQRRRRSQQQGEALSKPRALRVLAELIRDWKIVDARMPKNINAHSLCLGEEQIAGLRICAESLLNDEEFTGTGDVIAEKKIISENDRSRICEKCARAMRRAAYIPLDGGIIVCAACVTEWENSGKPLTTQPEPDRRSKKQIAELAAAVLKEMPDAVNLHQAFRHIPDGYALLPAKVGLHIQKDDLVWNLEGKFEKAHPQIVGHHTKGYFAVARQLTR